MSYRELRNFCEIMRGLGYPRLISIENFRNPNFELVADILFWLAQRFDPQADISDEIEEEKHRIQFIKQVAQLFRNKTRIKLNTKKLYASDGFAVQEILKVASILYKAYNSTPSDEDISQGFQLPSNLQDLKSHKSTANEITEIGARLHDSLSKEQEIKVHREKALDFLDNLSRNLDTNSEQQHIEKCVQQIIQQQDQQIEEMEKSVGGLERDQRTLEERIKKKTLDVEKLEKRLKIIKGMKPAYLDEYERLEAELEKMYEMYVERFRNLNYLENQLNQYNKLEQKYFEQSQKKIKELRDRNQEDEIRELGGKDDFDLSRTGIEDIERGQSRGDSRAIQSRANKKQYMGNVGEDPQEESNEGGSSLGEGEEGQDLEDSGEESQNDDF